MFVTIFPLPSCLSHLKKKKTKDDCVFVLTVSKLTVEVHREK